MYLCKRDINDMGLSIREAVDSLHKRINLYHYDLVVMPESSNRINKYLLRYIYRFNQPTLFNVEEILSDSMDADLISKIRHHFSPFVRFSLLRGLIEGGSHLFASPFRCISCGYRTVRLSDRSIRSTAVSGSSF